MKQLKWKTTETKKVKVEIEVKIGGITNLKYNVMFVRSSAPMLQLAIINLMANVKLEYKFYKYKINE